MTTGLTPPKAPKPKKRKRWRLTTAWATVIAALIASFVGGYFSRHDTSTVTSASSASASVPLPYVQITSVTWLPHDRGRYEVQGVAENLAAGEVLWTFSQPFDQNTPLNVYPDHGPCAVGDKGFFDCSLGFASGTPTDYNIIVAVVTDQQAYSFALQKDGLVKQAYYSSASDLPHVTGPNTLDSMKSTRTLDSMK